jgi:homoserine kinase
VRVSVPASSANLGPGFDALGLALEMPFVVSDEYDDTMLLMERTHPAYVSFLEAGGVGELWWRSPIPPGRGMGFSGAARVAGAFLAFLHADMAEAEARLAALWLAATLEGHPDNAAASALGGFTVASGGRAINVPIAFDAKVVVWWPDSETATNKSRAVLPPQVSFVDAVFNIGRTGLLVAALATGDKEAIRIATEDQLHQGARCALSPVSAETLKMLLAARPLGVWLGGSGPTVAALVEPNDADRVAAALPRDGHFRILDINHKGAQVLEPGNS